MPKKTKAYQDGLRAFEQKDYDKAFRLLIRYAEGGDSEAQAIIGNFHDLGLAGRLVDTNEAMKWYRRASAQGNGLASNNPGTIAFMQGDEEGAKRWYEKARAQGFAHSPSRRG
jgi:TPR repeat protein